MGAVSTYLCDFKRCFLFPIVTALKHSYNYMVPAAHTCLRAGGASSLPDALLYLFAPALVLMARRGVNAPHAYIERYVRSMTPFFTWMP